MSLGGRKITRESVIGENIIFLPRNEAEVEYLQKRLLEEGFSWSDGDRQVSDVADSLRFGLVLLDGAMYVKGENDTRDYTPCPIKQLDQDCPQPGEVSPQAAFNIAASLERIEKSLQRLEGRLDAVEAQLAPDRLDKAPRLKTSGGGGP